MPLPNYIENNRHKLEAILKQLIQNERQFYLDIATDSYQIESWNSTKFIKKIGEMNKCKR
jgi:hypothetical protein